MPPKQTTADVLARKGNGAAPTRKIDWTKYGARDVSDEVLTWRPTTEGDTITGRLHKVAEVPTKFGEKVVVELRECRNVIAGDVPGNDGDYTYWPTGGAISALFGCGADEGDLVTVSLVTLVDTGKGNPFKSFDAFVVDEEASF